MKSLLALAAVAALALSSASPALADPGTPRAPQSSASTAGAKGSARFTPIPNASPAGQQRLLHKTDRRCDAYNNCNYGNVCYINPLLGGGSCGMVVYAPFGSVCTCLPNYQGLVGY